MEKPTLLIWASGSKDGGGSGFEKLVYATKTGVLDAIICGVVSNHLHGGVREKADRLHIEFRHMSGFDIDDYCAITDYFRPCFNALSGWLKLAKGLPPGRTFNIHPGPPRFGGPGMHGHYVHEAVLNAFKRGEITHSAVMMHFVTPEYDKGPIFFYKPVPIFVDDNADTLGRRINKVEHEYQAWATDLVLRGLISWDGINGHPVKFFDGYGFAPPCP